MKPIIIALCSLCALFEIAAYIDLKKFLERYRNEIVERTCKGLMQRCVLMITAPVFLIVLTLAIHLFS